MTLAEHIRNLKELKKNVCNECSMRKKEIACCVSKIDDFRLCDYIVSLNFATHSIEYLLSQEKRIANKICINKKKELNNEEN